MIKISNKKTTVLIITFTAFCFSIIFSNVLMAYQTFNNCTNALQSIRRQKSQVCTNHQLANERFFRASTNNNIILSIGVMSFIQHTIYKSDYDIHTATDLMEHYSFYNIATANASLVMSFNTKNINLMTTSNDIHLPSYEEANSQIPTHPPSYEEANSDISFDNYFSSETIFNAITTNKSFQNFSTYSKLKYGSNLLYGFMECGNNTHILLLCPYNPNKEKRSFSQLLKYYIWDTFIHLNTHKDAHNFMGSN